MAISVFPQARVLMIEPQRELSDTLTQFCKKNQKLEYIPVGVGREPGQLVQTIWRDLAGSSFLPKPDASRLRSGEQRITSITTIDKILLEHPDFSPDLVKLDIQGFELEALKGSTSLFGSTELFILETSLYKFMPDMPNAAMIISYMDQNGYDLYDVTEFLRRPLDGALGQIDLAFALRRGRLRTSCDWDISKPDLDLT